MSHTTIDDIPEELLTIIFKFLDSKPPSELKIRQEPNLDLTRSETQPLKGISYVSKRWRRIVLPLLLKNARLRIDIPWREEWSKCPACGNPASKDEVHEVESYHTGMVAAFNNRQHTNNEHPVDITRPRRNFSTTRENFESPDEVSTAHWAWRFYHVLQDFCVFIEANELALSVRSFVLFSGRMLLGKLGRFPHQSAAREWRYPAAAALWQHLLSIIDPERVLILAPPTELACLTNAAIDTFGDWAFGDMDYHILQLQQSRTHPLTPSPPTTSIYTDMDLNPFPTHHPSIASSSLLHLRPWTHVNLNEGSFLRAYGTYEYFERGPPSLIYSIKQCLTQPRPTSSTTSNYLPSLRSFTYTAIFPFADHARFVEMLPYLEEIDLQFAPEPSSSILDDKARIGKAELSDCWSELLIAYADHSVAMSTARMSGERYPKLKRFVCRDMQIAGLRDDLDGIFTRMCLPVWVELEPGVFERVAMSPRPLEVDEFAD